MKKLITLLLLAVSLSVFAESPVSQLELAVREANVDCPFDLEDGLTITKLSTEANNVVYTCMVDEVATELTIEDMLIPEVNEVMKALLLESMQDTSDDDINEFRNLVKQARYNVVYRFINTNTGKKIDIKIYTNEL